MTLTDISPNLGTVGDAITLTGTGFGNTQGASTVSFAGTAATPSAWSDTSITVPVPAGASSGRIIVTVSGQVQADYARSWFEVIDASITSATSHLKAQDETADGADDRRYARAAYYNDLLNFFLNRIESRVLNLAVVTSGASYTVGATTNVVVINKDTGSATAVTLPSSPATGLTVTVKDGKGDAATNNITVSAASGNIDGSATSVISADYGARVFVYNGTQWNVA